VGTLATSEAVARPDALLTARDLASWLKIDVKTIYGYVQKGLIPYVRIQSNVRFRRQEILDWVEMQSYRPRSGHGKGLLKHSRN
jgi:excisionase family DNA binding protein